MFAPMTAIVRRIADALGLAVLNARATHLTPGNFLPDNLRPPDWADFTFRDPDDPSTWGERPADDFYHPMLDMHGIPEPNDPAHYRFRIRLRRTVTQDAYVSVVARSRRQALRQLRASRRRDGDCFNWTLPLVRFSRARVEEVEPEYDW